MNRQLVFGGREPGHLRRHVLGYFSLAIALLAVNYAMLLGLTTLGVPLLVAKVVSEVLLYIASFLAQKRLFRARRVSARALHTATVEV